MTLTRTQLARTIPLAEITDDDLDLVAIAGDDGFLFERDGAGMAGWGTALEIELPHGFDDSAAAQHVQRVLDRIDTTDTVGLPGCGPIAIAAFPFWPGAPARMIVPSTVVGRAENGTRWITTFGDGSEVLARLEVGRPEVAVPDAFTLTPSMTHVEWERLVASAVGHIRRGNADKIVLAREVIVSANRPIDVASVLERLRALYPSCLAFSIDGFVGASPELLVRRRGQTVTCHPLAGTIPRSGDPVTDAELAAEMLASTKERAEHRFAVEDVAAALKPRCVALDVPDHPSIVQLRNVSHLGTRIEGTLTGGDTALALAGALHPTAAVGGTPRQPALEWLARNEGFARGPYAGPVGWVDRRGDGEFVVGIRSALIDGADARLFAGVGVVADSDPAAELAETQLKLQALLAALVRP